MDRGNAIKIAPDLLQRLYEADIQDRVRNRIKVCQNTRHSPGSRR